MPDFVTRVAVNPVKAVHLDAGGVLRVFRATVAPYDESFRQLGGGASLNARVSLSGATALIGQGAVGSGLGRYVGGLVPDVAFRSDGSISPIGTYVVGGGRGAQNVAAGGDGRLLQRGCGQHPVLPWMRTGTSSASDFPARQRRTTAGSRK